MMWWNAIKTTTSDAISMDIRKKDTKLKVTMSIQTQILQNVNHDPNPTHARGTQKGSTECFL